MRERRRYGPFMRDWEGPYEWGSRPAGNHSGSTDAGELGHEVWIGDAAKIRASCERKGDKPLCRANVWDHCDDLKLESRNYSRIFCLNRKLRTVLIKTMPARNTINAE